MKPHEFYAQLGQASAALAALPYNPYYRRLSGLDHGRTRVNDRPCLDLASNDYLGLASDPRLKAAIVAAIEEYGSSQCGTPVATGYAHVLAALEQDLSHFLGLEASVIFPSCYQANTALFPALATPRDVFLVDHYAHASLAQGIKAVGCKIKPFLHNDVAHLERQLAAARGFRQIFVVTESVFSTEGSVAPMADIVDLCRRYEAIPVVDDSHGLGVLGKNGRGIIEAQDLANFDGIYTASLGKALANLGGIVAGRRSLISALRYSCPGLIYSTALPPACAGGVLKALEIIRAEFPILSRRLWRNHGTLTEHLRLNGWPVAAAPAPIAAIPAGSAEETIALASAFANQGILATPFVPPSVPPGQGVLRLIVGAKLDEHGMAELTQAIAATRRALQSGGCDQPARTAPTSAGTVP